MPLMSYALGRECADGCVCGGREFLEHVGHDRETTLMEVTKDALKSVDLRILQPENVQVNV